MKIDKLSIALGTVIGTSMIFVGNIASRIFSDGLLAGIVVMIAWLGICFLIILIAENRANYSESQTKTETNQSETQERYHNSPIATFYKEEKFKVIKELEDKYPKLKESNKIQRWVDLYMKIKFDDNELKDVFLKNFEDVLSGIDK